MFSRSEMNRHSTVWPMRCPFKTYKFVDDIRFFFFKSIRANILSHLKRFHHGGPFFETFENQCFLGELAKAPSAPEVWRDFVSDAARKLAQSQKP